MFGAAFGLGFILGPAIAGILSKYGIHIPFYVAAALSFANASALYFILPESSAARGPGKAAAHKNRLLEFASRSQEQRVSRDQYCLLPVDHGVLDNDLRFCAVHGLPVRLHNANRTGICLLLSVWSRSLLRASLWPVGKAFWRGSAWWQSDACSWSCSLFAVPYVGPHFGGLCRIAYRHGGAVPRQFARLARSDQPCIKDS